MPWMKVDDGFHDHPKVDDLPLEAVGLWLLCGTYCARHLTDGFVNARRVQKMGGTPETINALLESGLWDEAEGGYQFHDWHEYQPTKAKTEAEREANRERQRKYRRNARGEYTGTDETTNAVRNAVTDDVTNDVSNTTPSRPVPSRPQSAERRTPERPIPADWSPNDAHKAYATDRSLDLHLEAERFKAHAEANQRKLRNWDAGFRMWLTKARPKPQETFNPWTT